MLKKGQLTLFIIIGIVILFLVGLVIFQRNVGLESDTEPNLDVLDVTEIKSFVDNCLDKTFVDGIEIIGMQGGYYYPEDYISVMGFFVPVYHDFRKGDQMPTLDSVENELELYISEFLPMCIDLTAFEGYQIQDGEMTVDVSLMMENDADVDIYYPLSIRKNDAEVQISTFSASAELPLRKGFDVSRRFIDRQILNPNMVPMDYMAQLAYEGNFTYEIMTLNDTYIYVLDLDDFIYTFALNYNWSVSS